MPKNHTVITSKTQYLAFMAEPGASLLKVFYTTAEEDLGSTTRDDLTMDRIALVLSGMTPQPQINCGVVKNPKPQWFNWIKEEQRLRQVSYPLKHGKLWARGLGYL